ncbi:protein of unknown function [Devosia enhydra]|uniref:Membrane-anchored ribosome-binding protein, inhibits growth in stationary phase, ElaB/YqjD/DUF883 family n=1 Tax=Devosia enhydra TaxID=665118 RepID=A0A1K2HW93_9HYPH|nr:DUF883 family protein [Devosia enhydra]SFZ83247.1 protein of unknown function [Devosia enhydra]
MADTEDVVADAASKARNAARRTVDRAREEKLEEQVSRLQDDLKRIADTLTRMGESKVEQAHGAARREVRHLVANGQQALDSVQDEFSQVERQLKDTIRQKPLTAVAGALAVGFVLALLTR